MSKNLSVIVPGYPEEYPQNLADLVEAEIETITDPVARELRKQTLAVVRAGVAHFINGPWDVLELLTSGYVLRSWDKAWASYALDPSRQPILVPNQNGVSTYLKKHTKLLPKIDDLPPLYTGREKTPPKWLVIYGGSPEILKKEPVRKGLLRLTREVKVADFIFFQKGDNEAPVLWSTKAGTGVTGTTRPTSQEVSFPDPELITALKEAL